MAEKSGLFNAVGGVPSYDDVDMATMFSLLTGGQGYLVGKDNELEVTAGTGLEVLVGIGAAWIGEPNGWWYINKASKSLTLDAETSGYDRIDRIVLRLDRNSSVLSVTAEVLKGTPAASDPVAPAMTKNDTVYELSLAKVYITGGSTSIAVTDERDSECGKVYAGWSGSNQEHTITSTNGNTYDAYPLGVSYSMVTSSTYQQSEQTDNTDFPVSDGTLLTIKKTIYRFFQYYHVNNGHALYYRSYYNNTWQPWRRLDSGDEYETVSFTLALKHMNCFVRCSHATGMTVTIPADTFPQDIDITIWQMGDGQVTIEGGVGVVLVPTDYTTFKTREKGECTVIRHYSNNAWAVMGADKS